MDIMKEQVLSVAQMQELMKLGIDVSKASMCYNYNDEKSQWNLVINYSHSPYIDGEIVPTFTLEDILKLLNNPTLRQEDDDFYSCEVNTETGSSTASGKTALNAAYNLLKHCYSQKK